MAKHYGMTFYGLYSPRVVEEEVLPIQKSVSLKYSPDQPRDEFGRFDDGSSSGYKPFTVDPKKVFGVESTYGGTAYQITQQRKGDHKIDAALEALIKTLGADGQPQLVESKEELTGTKIYRGIHPGEKTADEYATEYKTEDSVRQAYGTYGNGTYFASNERVAMVYGTDGKSDREIGDGAMIYASISPEANVLSLQPANGRFAQFVDLREQVSKIEQEVNPGGTQTNSMSESQLAVMLGYDAMKIRIPADNSDYYVIFNRTALQVVK